MVAFQLYALFHHATSYLPTGGISSTSPFVRRLHSWQRTATPMLKAAIRRDGRCADPGARSTTPQMLATTSLVLSIGFPSHLWSENYARGMFFHLQNKKPSPRIAQGGNIPSTHRICQPEEMLHTSKGTNAGEMASVPHFKFLTSWPTQSSSLLYS